MNYFTMEELIMNFKDEIYHKYFVYIDDGENVYKIAIAAADEDAARKWCEGNGEVIAVKDVTDNYHIDTDKVARALKDAEFKTEEIDWMIRTLRELEIIE